MTQQPSVGQGFIIVEALRSHSDTPHSVGVLWTGDQLLKQNRNNIILIMYSYCYCLCMLIVMYCLCILIVIYCLRILIVMYVLFCIFCFHRANWHSSATLTEVFPRFFLSYKANARVKLVKTGHGPHSSHLVICVCSMYCLCVYVYCTTATGCQPNCI